MNHSSKNKLLTCLVVLLLIANAATIIYFWLNKRKEEPKINRAAPNEFLVTELNLDDQQQKKLDSLVRDHRLNAETLRKQMKEAKDQMFELIKDPNATDSAKQNAARKASMVAEKLDLVTLDHFASIRAMCRPEQQTKFDNIILQVTRMMAQPRPPMRPGGPPHDGPPPPGDMQDPAGN
jgi:hypothetical protein